MIIDYPPNENETPYYPSQVESSSQTLYVPHIEEGISSVEGGNSKIFDTGDLFHLNLSLDNRTVSLIQEND